MLTAMLICNFVDIDLYSSIKMERSHRLFLQCFMAKPFMSEQDAKDAYSKCIEIFQGMTTFISNIKHVYT
jgi:hypothetical protein